MSIERCLKCKQFHSEKIDCFFKAPTPSPEIQRDSLESHLQDIRDFITELKKFKLENPDVFNLIIKDVKEIFEIV